MQRHWSRLGSAAGATLLLGWPLSRYAGLRVVQAVRRRGGGESHTWREVWRRRNEWLPGY
jgi:hypothetical protein